MRALLGLLAWPVMALFSWLVVGGAALVDGLRTPKHCKVCFSPWVIARHTTGFYCHAHYPKEDSSEVAHTPS